MRTKRPLNLPLAAFFLLVFGLSWQLLMLPVWSSGAQTCALAGLFLLAAPYAKPIFAAISAATDNGEEDEEEDDDEDAPHHTWRNDVNVESLAQGQTIEEYYDCLCGTCPRLPNRRQQVITDSNAQRRPTESEDAGA